MLVVERILEPAQPRRSAGLHLEYGHQQKNGQDEDDPDDDQDGKDHGQNTEDQPKDAADQSEDQPENPFN
jgi:hypothetical protein